MKALFLGMVAVAAWLAAAAQPTPQLVLRPDTNHVLKVVLTDDPAANMASYANPGQPLAPGGRCHLAGCGAGQTKDMT